LVAASPRWTGIGTSFGGKAVEWPAPYPKDKVNAIPWRFNNANQCYTAASFRWMAMTQPAQARWVLNRFDKYLPHAYDGEFHGIYSPSSADRLAPPYFGGVQRGGSTNQTTLWFFLGEPLEKIEERLDRLGRTPALAPWSTETMTLSYGRGFIQQLVAASVSSPMWASAWEPRVIWKGTFNPSTGKATLIVEPGDAPLHFKGTSRLAPIGVSVNGRELPE
jgi:hypothetical protein